MAYYLKEGLDSITIYTDSDDDGENYTYHIAVIKFSDGRVRIEDSVKGIEFFADIYTEFPDGGFVAKNPEHEFTLV